MTPHKINPVVLVGVPTLQKAPISWEWTDYFMALTFPLGASVARTRITGKIVAEARNIIVEQALSTNADYVFMISDDVLAPSRTFELLWRHRKHIVTGVYWTKTQPTAPYLWNGLMKGPFLDWKFGEFFKVDWAGCDCLLVHTDVFRKIKAPWFSHDWAYEEKSAPANLATEDLYFYTKAKEAGFDLWCDSAVQCDHQDRATGIRYGLTELMPQVEMRKGWKLFDSGKKIADIGSGKDTPYFGNDVSVTRIDGDPRVKPDILCDIRAIPVPPETYDVVHARHVLEHFSMQEHPALLKEWIRILKVGGELIINVPNLAFAAKQILHAAANPDYDAMYAYWQLYGRQEDHSDTEVHRCGFTKHGLKRLLDGIEWLCDVVVSESGQDDINLEARAKKLESSYPYAIVPAWNRVAAIEEKSTLQINDVLPTNGKVELELVDDY